MSSSTPLRSGTRAALAAAILMATCAAGGMAARGPAGGTRHAEASGNGSECHANADCNSGICAAGVCCATQCTGPCEACFGGTCAPLAKGSVPSCGNCCGSVACDGTSGGCQALCSTTTDCVPGSFCQTESCLPKNDSGTSCQSSDECASGNCYGGTCLGLAVLGAACALPSDCASGACVDSVCCDRACEGQCEACDGTGALGKRGTCSPLDGVPRGSRPACSDAGTTCPGSCKGSTGNVATCEYPDAGANCRPLCTTNTDCPAGTLCEEGACEPGGAFCLDAGVSQSTTNGAVTSCGAFLCDRGSGECLTQCTNVEDCLAPNVCDPKSAQCVPPPESAVPVTGCACAVPAGARSSAPPWLLALAFPLAVFLAGARGRRRRLT